MNNQNNTTNSLAHTKWNCKYHIVFAPKYRRKVFYEKKRAEIREILKTLCQFKGVKIIEGAFVRKPVEIGLFPKKKNHLYLRGRGIFILCDMNKFFII